MPSGEPGGSAAMPTCSTISCLPAVWCCTSWPSICLQAACAASYDLSAAVRLKHRLLSESQKSVLLF